MLTPIRSAILGLMFSVAASALASTVDPLRPVGIAKDGAQILALSLSDYEAMKKEDHVIIRNFQRGSGALLNLSVERMNIFADDAKIVVATLQGEHEIPRPDVQFFSGEVIGEPGSRVFLALSPNGTSGTIISGGETSIISSGPGGNMPTVIYETSSVAAAGIHLDSHICGGGLLAPGEMAGPAIGDVASPESYACRTYRLAIDCDTEFTAVDFNGDQNRATTYVSTLVAGMNDIYRRDANVIFNLAYVRLWVGTDPYTAANTGDQLGEFQAYWQANMGSVNRNLTHMLSARGLGGGVAWVNQVCTQYSYAVSANMSGFFPYPLLNNRNQNWDIMVFSHETGHNVGTGHTHDINSYDPIIDGCGNGDCTVAAAHQGTIMSYCHTCSGGMTNIRLELGPRVAAAIRGYLDNTPCGVAPTVAFNSHPRNRSVCYNGYAPFSVSVTAPPPVTYQWQLNGVNIPGATSSSYTVAQANANTVGSYTCIASSTCVSATSNPGVLSVCFANFNCDGAVDFFDYLDFVDAFSMRDSSADFNADGAIDFFDYLDFVDAYSQGC